MLEQHADKIKVVYDQYSKDWAAAEAKKNMEAALAKFGKNIQGVVTGYDGLVDGAIVALSAYGLAGKVPILVRTRSWQRFNALWKANKPRPFTSRLKNWRKRQQT